MPFRRGGFSHILTLTWEGKKRGDMGRVRKRNRYNYILIKNNSGK